MLRGKALMRFPPAITDVMRVVEVKQCKLLLPPFLVLLLQFPQVHVVMLGVDVPQKPGLVQDHIQRKRSHQEAHVEGGAWAEPFHQEQFPHDHHTRTEKQKQNEITGAFMKITARTLVHPAHFTTQNKAGILRGENVDTVTLKCYVSKQLQGIKMNTVAPEAL